jgi:hypothetical protein
MGYIVDLYRTKMVKSISEVNQDLSKTPHFETRVGKRRWNERVGGGSGGGAGKGKSEDA